MPVIDTDKVLAEAEAERDRKYAEADAEYDRKRAAVATLLGQPLNSVGGNRARSVRVWSYSDRVQITDAGRAGGEARRNALMKSVGNELGKSPLARLDQLSFPTVREELDMT